MKNKKQHKTKVLLIILNLTKINKKQNKKHLKEGVVVSVFLCVLRICAWVCEFTGETF